jgi:hypothetical protein
MPQEYTRQRQGRDFLSHGHSQPADMSGGTQATSLYEQLERYKQEAERNAVSVDGAEPPIENGGNARER